MNLEQCRRAARPGFALCFGDAFDVINVGARLRKDVVQVVADADEAEPFVEKLSDTSGAEEKEAEDDVVLASFGDEFIRGGA